MNTLELLKDELIFETQRCKVLFNSKVFVPTVPTECSIFAQSALIEILIRLNYVLQQLDKKLNNRITWNDDIQTDQKIKDITDLVNNLRNAVCHSDSPENYINNTSIKFIFNTVAGKCPNAVRIGNLILGCDYKDDIAFYYGDKRIYLVRHIKKLLDELPNKIKTAP